jgi:hypothetical protein
MRKQLPLVLITLMVSCGFVFAQQGASVVILGPKPGESKHPTRVVGSATATFVEETKQVTVQGSQISLFGDVDNGLTLAPSFAVLGSKVVAPVWIDLTIVFSSSTRRAAPSGGIAFKIDGKLLSGGTVKVTSSKRYPSGSLIHVLLQRIPYQQFVRMLDAKKVEGRFGGQDFVLSQSQLMVFHDLKNSIEAGIDFGAK